MPAPNSLQNGILAAAMSALAFGLSAPAVARLGAGLGPFTTAALLYAGALCSSWTMSGFDVRPALWLMRRHGARIGLIAFLGAAIGPAAFAWGLQKTGATSGSLLLNFEAIFTAVLAWRLFAEPFGTRFTAALALMAAGGAVLAIDGARKTELHPLGLLAIAFATLCWALDNTLTRPLSEEPPFAVVAAKSALGAGLAFVLARALAEPMPAAAAALPCVLLLLVGAIGYGLSLRLYLEAQTRIGAARTASVFALAPFAGALAAWLFGDRVLGWGGALSVPLFALGAYLHLTERHQHAHRHEVLEHEHAHRHDDGHHLHTHVPPVSGEHTHAHRHELLAHSHDHAPDLHHQHDHASAHTHERSHTHEH